MDEMCIVIVYGAIPTLLSIGIVIWFLIKPPKSRQWLTYISVGLTIISLVVAFTTRAAINWSLSCIFVLITLICLVLEQTFKKRKESYKFFTGYSGIQTEYERIENLIKKKTICNIGNNKEDLIEQCVNFSLENIRHNMSLFYSYFLNESVYSTEEKGDKSKKAKRKRKEFFVYNFKNAHDYIYLSKHKDINIEIFSNIFYSIYERVREDFLAPLLFETNTKVPEFIAKELDNAILGIQNVKKQFNTSKYTMKDFYDLYKTEIPQKIKGVESRRIFIYQNDAIEKYKIITDEVFGSNPEINLIKIPLLLWVLEWHKKNNIKVGFILEEEASKMQRLEKGISTLDFSITHIEQNDSSSKINGFKDIVLKLNGEPRTETFYNIPIKYHSLTAYTEDYEDETADEAEHFNFFNKLWEESQNNISIIRKKLLESNSWYSGITDDEKTKIKNVLDKVYPESIAVTP